MERGAAGETTTPENAREKPRRTHTQSEKENNDGVKDGLGLRVEPEEAGG